MSDNEDNQELRRMQAEWRHQTTRDIDAVKDALSEIIATLSSLRGEFAKQSDTDKLRDRISSLEGDRAKMLGGWFVLTAGGGLLLWVLNKVWK